MASIKQNHLINVNEMTTFINLLFQKNIVYMGVASRGIIGYKVVEFLWPLKMESQKDLK